MNHTSKSVAVLPDFLRRRNSGTAGETDGETAKREAKRKIIAAAVQWSLLRTKLNQVNDDGGGYQTLQEAAVIPFGIKNDPAFTGELSSFPTYSIFFQI